MNALFLLLELKSSFLFFMFTGIALAFGAMMYADRANHRMPYYGAMVGVASFFACDAAAQFWYWLGRHFGAGRAEMLLIGVLVASLGMAVGGVCILRNFTVARYGHRLWLAVVAGSVVLAMATTWLASHTLEISAFQWFS